MKLSINEELAQFLSQIRRLAAPNKIWLVGGAVRDLFLGKAVKDLDFVLADGSARLAKKVRKHFEGVSYSLDDERQTARVILRMGEPDELIIDFASFIGENLEEDLRQRDFRINSMAIDLDNLSQVLDPLDGLSDLDAKKLLLGGPNSLENDPLRVIRLVRMMRTYGLEIDSETKELARRATEGLDRVSGERIRDEFLKCLNLPHIAETFRLLEEYGIFNKLFELAGFQAENDSEGTSFKRFSHTSKFLRELENLLDEIYNGKEISDSNVILSQNHKLEKSFDNLHNLLTETIQGGRSRRQLLLLFAFFFSRIVDCYGLRSETEIHSDKKLINCEEFSKKLSQFLMMGVKEEKHFASLCHGFFGISKLEQEEEVTNLDFYRFFKLVGSSGVESALVVIANQNAFEQPKQTIIDLAERVICIWFFEQESLVNPPRLVDGLSLQQKLNLKAGPKMGEYLEAIREAQVMGLVKTEEEALEFVKILMSELN